MKALDLSRIEPLEARIAPAFAPVIELSGLNGSNGIRIVGETAGSGAGYAISDAGDVNRDGVADMLISAITDGSAGAVYVVFGKAGLPATFNLAALDGTNGFKIVGESTGDQAGISVAAASDFNGDGIDDIVIGAPYAGVNGQGLGYVIFGRAGALPATFNLTSINGTNGVRFEGFAPGDLTGTAVGAADLNDDGLSDIIIGAPHAGANGSARGAVYVVYGTSANLGPVFGLASLDGSNGFSIAGENANDNLGRSLNSAGDVNGDNVADFIIGAPSAGPNGTESGAAYVIFGSTSGFGASLNLATLPVSSGFKLNGVAVGDSAGTSVRGAGDFNGDGLADIVIGAPGADPNGADSGAAYVFFGKFSGFTSNFNLSSLDGTTGFRISGAAAGDRLGSVVSGLGDINSDGPGDLLITAPGADPNGADSGGAYVVFGRGSAPGPNFNVTALNGANGFKINGVAASDHAGFAGSRGSDFNGDGLRDVFLGAPDASANGTGSGAGYVIYGMRERLVVTTTADTTDFADGQLSLREAIQIANGQGGLDFIDFNIAGTGVRTITVANNLPVVTDPIVIDGFTQPGSSPNSNGLGQGFNSVLLVQLQSAGFPSIGLNLATGDSTIRGLVITGFIDDSGILLSSASSDRNLIEGNFIGINPAGTAADKNGDGISVKPGGTDNTIRGNVISGNSSAGISIFGDVGSLSVTGNKITGNFIGTDRTGLVAIPNGTGIELFNNAIANTIGGPTLADRNLISGNRDEGIDIFGAPGSGRPVNNNVVQGNYIGTDITGAGALGNGSTGIELFTDATGNMILNNVISANAADGIAIYSNAINTVVKGNFLGTTAAGTLRAGLANSASGIQIFASADGTILGGPGAGGRNVIVGGLFGPVRVSDTVGVVIQNNIIGLSPGAVPPPDANKYGIEVDASTVLIGGTGPGEGNVISFNAGHGVTEVDPSIITIRGNSIFSNAMLGIHRTTNLGIPTITSASRNAAGFAVVGGTFTGTPSSNFEVEVFAQLVADPSGFGEGEDYIGFVTGTTDASGNGTFAFTSPTTIAPGTILTATVTGPDGNTTQFSNAVATGSSGAVVWVGSISNDWFTAGNWSAGRVPGSGDAVTLDSASTIKLSAPAVIGSFTMSDGTFTGVGELTITGLFTWTGGTMSGTGTTHANGGVLMNGGEVLLASRTLDLPSSQTSTLTGSTALLRLKDGALIENAGTFLIQDASAILDASGPLSLVHNTGSFTRDTGVGEFLVDVPFANDGIIKVAAGTLEFGNGLHQSSTASIVGPGDVQFDGGLIEVSGTIATNVFNTGAVLSPGGEGVIGSLTIQGNYTQGALARLSLDLGGNTSGANADTLIIQGVASFAGGLAVNTVGSLVLHVGDSFSSVSYSSATGGFDFTEAPSGVAGVLNSDSLLVQANAPVTGSKSVTLIDVDGDKIIVKVNKGAIPGDAFTIGPNNEIQLIDLRAVDSKLKGATLTITVEKSGGGDGTVNIGAIEARGIDLGSVVINGDLGQLDIGTGNPKKLALKSLVVNSLGLFGASTQAPNTPNPLVSDIAGGLGSLKVKGDVEDVIFNVTGKLGKTAIAGDFGGASTPVATIRNFLAHLDSGIPRVSGGVPGGAFNAGSVGTFSVGQNVEGGSVTSDGNIGTVSVRGDVNSGAILSQARIKNVKIVGSLVSDDPEDPAIIAALAKVNPKKSSDALALDGLRVKGNVENARILLGYNKQQEPTNSDGSIGSIVVGGNWSGTSIAAGVADITGDGFGQNDALIGNDTTAKIVAKIASITIKGTATGTADAGDFFAITAESIGKITIDGQKIALDKSAPDDILLDPVNNDFRLIELPR